MPPPSPAIHSVGLAVPDAVDQLTLTQLNESLVSKTDEDRIWLRKIYSRAGVQTRGCVHGADLAKFYTHQHNPTTAERMKEYAHHAPPLLLRATRDAIEKSQLRSSDITHLVTATCTGFVSPGLDAQLIEQLPLRRNVHRAQIGFMGCHAALNAIESARSIVRGDPDAVVLVGCVELCSLHMSYENRPESIVANALFGDGAAAVIIRVQPTNDRWRILASASHLLPDTSELMTWTIGDHGFKMTLSAEVPRLIQKHLRPWLAEFLGNQHLKLDDLRHFAVHPGGPKILQAVEQALALPERALEASRRVLKMNGNMSSTTTLFILNELQDASGLCLALAFGPGLMLEAMLLER